MGVPNLRSQSLANAALNLFNFSLKCKFEVSRNQNNFKFNESFCVELKFL